MAYRNGQRDLPAGRPRMQHPCDRRTTTAERRRVGRRSANGGDAHVGEWAATPVATDAGPSTLNSPVKHTHRGPLSGDPAGSPGHHGRSKTTPLFTSLRAGTTRPM